MKRVLAALEAETREYAKAPLFAFLRDRTVDARKRLAFAPSVAHFVMTFADLYAHVLPVEPAQDEYQKLVNAHVREDENHWRWFVADLAKLDSDPRLAFSDALRFVWSDATLRTRMLSYQMCRLGFGADSLQKLVLVHCIEAAGKVTIEHVAEVGNEFSISTGKRLVYFGPHHFDTEGDHTIEQPETHRGIERIELPASTASALGAVVKETFSYFKGFADDMFSSARSGSGIA